MKITSSKLNIVKGRGGGREIKIGTLFNSPIFLNCWNPKQEYITAKAYFTFEGTRGFSVVLNVNKEGFRSYLFFVSLFFFLYATKFQNECILAVGLIWS